MHGCPPTSASPASTVGRSSPRSRCCPSGWSVRSPFLDPASVARWGERAALSVEVRGDGRSWAVEVRTFSDTGGWIATVSPPADDFAVIEVPWAAFAPVTRFLDPRDAPAPLDPTDIASVAFYLIDGIEAPFRLEVRSIS